MSAGGEDGRDGRVPSMLELVQLSRRRIFPPGGLDLYRQIALLTGLEEGQELLDVACGRAVALEYFVEEYGVHGAGVERDPALVSDARARIRARALNARMEVQTGRYDGLPYRDEIFDVVVGELGFAAGTSPRAAVAELARVTRRGGWVALIRLVWRAPVDDERARLLTEHLGARPLMTVEWKQLLRDVGVRQLHTEDWSDDETAFREGPAKPYPDFAEIFSLPEKIGILRRAWRRWGWRGVRSLLAREREIHGLLTRERVLGLDLVMGKRVAQEAPPDDTDASEAE